MTTKRIQWSERKNRTLMAERGISFEEVLEAIATGNLLDVRENQSGNHRGQRVFIVHLHDYPWVVPFEETKDAIWLKTAYPDRKLKREFKIFIATQ